MFKLFRLLPLEREAMGERSECNLLVMIPSTGGGLGLVGMTYALYLTALNDESANKRIRSSGHV